MRRFLSLLAALMVLVSGLSLAVYAEDEEELTVENPIVVISYSSADDDEEDVMLTPDEDGNFTEPAAPAAAGEGGSEVPDEAIVEGGEDDPDELTTRTESVSEPVITATAENEIVAIGETVVISAEAVGTEGALSWQWQKSTNNGVTWGSSTLSGNKTDTLTFEATVSRLAAIYRVKVVDANGTWYSNTVQVSVPAPAVEPTITATAASATVEIGETVVISAVAENTTGSLSWQWQKSTNNGASWSSTTLSGNKTDTLTFEATESRLAAIYRVKVVDESGTWYRNTVQVSVPVPAVAPTITVTAASEPVEIGDTVVISAVAADTVGSLSWQWQKSTNDGASWSSTTLSGNKTDTLTFEATESRLAAIYRVRVIDDNGTWYSNTVQVSVPVPAVDPTITATAASETVELGDTVVISAVAENTVGNVTWQWQKSTNDGATWSSTTLSGNKTDTLTFEANASRLAAIYRVRVIDANGTWYSNTVQVSVAVHTTVVITPVYSELNAGDTLTLTAEVTDATGTPTYSWEFSNDSGVNWTAIENATEAVYTTTAGPADAGLYRCVVTDENGDHVSEHVTVEVTPTFVENEVTYTIMEDGVSLIVTGYAGTSASVVIPQYPREGYEVKQIGASAFEGNTALTSIDLPDSVEVIGARAFANCSNLASMN